MTDAEKENRPTSVMLICVGNKLLLDEGIGPAVYDELVASYDFPSQVSLYDAGCMSLDMLPLVEKYDYFITVDAVDQTGSEPGTIFRYRPSDMARRSVAAQSLHDLRLVDLFDAAILLGYEADGICYGMQVENMSPAEITIGLTPRVYDALPKLIDSVLAELTHLGVEVRQKDTGKLVGPDTPHVLRPHQE